MRLLLDHTTTKNIIIRTPSILALPWLMSALCLRHLTVSSKNGFLSVSRAQTFILTSTNQSAGDFCSKSTNIGWFACWKPINRPSELDHNFPTFSRAGRNRINHITGESRFGSLGI